MNGFKKFMGTALAALMVAGSGSMIFARDFEDVTEESGAKTEISILSDIGIIKGKTDTEFAPDEAVTREQMAMLMFRLMLNKEDAGRGNTTEFQDLYEPYYNGAISWANAAGYIYGTARHTFNPQGGIKLQDAMTMLVRALGQDSEKMNDNYPWSYINAAIRLGLDRGLENVAYEDTLTRGQTAVILYNALTAEYLIPRTTANGNVYMESTSIIEEVFGYDMAQATVVATNHYSIDGQTVVRNGYVTLRSVDSEGEVSYLTVPYADMHLDGTADSKLGNAYRILYQTKNGKTAVLSAVAMSESESYDAVKLDKKNNVVEIGGAKYTLVDEYSDALATNNNELKLYAYDDDGRLSLVKDLAELEDLLGFYRVTLQYDNGAELARRGLIRVYEMGQLDVNAEGKINLAGKLTEADLTGGYENAVEAENGDYVLYYYNEAVKDFEIAQVLQPISGAVRRITSSTVRIGDETYDLGNATAGISADSIREKLTLGAQATAIVYHNAVVAVLEGVHHSNASQYLVAESDSQRVYENGNFRYVASVFVDGQSENVFVAANNAKAGEIYRYTVTGDTYTLIPAEEEDGIILTGSKRFVQSDRELDEMAVIIKDAKDTKIELNGRNYYTIDSGEGTMASSVRGLTSVRFVTDDDTMILVNDNGRLMARTGAYNSTIHVNDGAVVTAIFDNEVGAVETLRCLYITDGSLGNYNLYAEYVRILAKVGQVYEDGTAYVEYTVYNFMTDEVETRLSKYDDLMVGADYRTGTDDCVTNETTSHVMNGFVNGYTAATVTIDGRTFPLAQEAQVIQFENNKAVAVKLSSLYMTNVDYVVIGGEVTHIIASGAAKIAVRTSDAMVTLIPDFDLAEFDEETLSVTEMKKGEEEVDIAKAEAAYGENNTIEIKFANALEEGEYTLTFQLAGSSFTVKFTVEAAKEPDSGDNQGESEGDNQGESEGDNQGESEGDNQGESEGDNQGESEGDNQGESEEDNQ